MLFDVNTEAWLKDPLLFWKDNQSKFPNLSAMACDFLHLQASSTCSEHVWSDMGNVITAKRNRLDPKTVEMLCLLKSNTTFW
jgi:hypothetical protein